MIDQCSIRVYALNTLTILMSFTTLEEWLKLLLLVISIIYTCMKISDWVLTKLNKKNGNNDKEALQD